MLRFYFLVIILIPLLASGQQNACPPIPDLIDGQKVLKLADKMPEYPGGQLKMLRDIKEQFKYPEEQTTAQEKVNLTFIIDSLGQLTNACIFKPFDENSITPVEQSMLAIIHTLPAWTPGENKGKKVAVRILLPILIERQK